MEQRISGKIASALGRESKLIAYFFNFLLRWPGRNKMKRISAVLFTCCLSFSAFAGCIGPVIMGECKGQVVQWDTHPQGPSRDPPAGPGFYYDKRGTNAEQENPGTINPFTGRDAHDADMGAQ
jgi:hypothetical protein